MISFIHLYEYNLKRPHNLRKHIQALQEADNDIPAAIDGLRQIQNLPRGDNDNSRKRGGRRGGRKGGRGRNPDEDEKTRPANSLFVMV